MTTFWPKRWDLLKPPNPSIRRIGMALPAETIETYSLQSVKVDAFQTARIDHVIFGVCARTIEGSDAAMTTEVVERASGSEPVRRQNILSADKTESIWRDHVMEVSLTLAD